jgi:uncharacterized membrane protein
MFSKIWRNRIEFYPYISLFILGIFFTFLYSLAVQSQPGIVTLGVAAIPALLLIIIAAVKTYRELPDEGTAPSLKATRGAGTTIKAFTTSTPEFERKASITAFTALILVLAVFTYIHFAHPTVFNVPDNGDVSTWEHPTFEQSVIYDRMTPEERETVYQNGIPSHVKNPTVGQIIAGAAISFGIYGFFCILCFLHARKHFGLLMASCFFLGSFVFTGMEETIFILFGRFLGGSFNNILGEPFTGTYWFTFPGKIWLLECPGEACFGWFIWAYPSVWIAGKVFSRMPLYFRATVGGLIAMTIDLWLDPVSTSPEIMEWVWAKGDTIILFGIPLSNFIGWFLLIAVFAVLWEKLPIMQEKWGPKKGTVYFFIIIFCFNFLITATIFILTQIYGGILALAGFEHALNIPSGW